MNNNQVIELYESGKSSYEVSDITGISATQVRRILKKFSIEAKHIRTPIVIENKIVDRYMAGDSSEKIASDFGLNGTTVCRILKRRNIQLRSISQRHRKINLKESILDNIDREWKAYFLGFMYADGNVSSSRNAFSITLHNKDVDILKRFSDFFYGEDRTVCRKEPYVNLAVYSAKLKNKLVSYGCVPNKTFKTVMPVLKQDLIRHFIRGLYDGDGCISTANNRVRVVLTGYSEFLNEVSDTILENNQNIQPTIRLIKTNVSDLTIGRQSDCVDFLNWIYQDSTIYLGRKYESYQNVLNLCKPSNHYGSSNIVSYNGEKLTHAFISQLSIAERESIAKFLLSHFRRNGFPYQYFGTSDLKDDFENLCNVSKQINGDVGTLPECGLNIFKHFCPHFYEVRNNNTPSMVDVFNDDELLMSVIRNRLGITYKEVFNITGNMIRQGIRNSRKGFAASSFKPSLAKAIYDKFVPENGIVLDISAGFGQRMLGAMASKKVKRYIGLDPWEKQITALSNIKSFFGFENIELYQTGSEKLHLPHLKDSVDFCFSSPPFFDKEIYSNDSTQAYHNRSFDEFLYDWWKPTVNRVYELLKPNACFVLNMNLPMAMKMFECTKNLFIEADRFYLSFARKHLSSDSKDNFFVLRKI
jgi:tRNA1(Val) A37 N6-methylase TrmN6